MTFINKKYLERCPFCDCDMGVTMKEGKFFAVHPSEGRFDCWFRDYSFEVTEESRVKWNQRYIDTITHELTDIRVYAEDIIQRIDKIRKVN